ncbi:hypothetical protein [Plastoroseomonas hellenica]|uniref:hypothetical protein n=1 Tax=Plastoroseomonas hellenica TaxID=2687306 RepID=UPI001BA566F9|nr:hypothetical protein [Plastoroseomonas hellenica]MBR0645338.1 hypothetical protein [Plastoroseomonas hellenica]
MAEVTEASLEFRRRMLNDPPQKDQRRLAQAFSLIRGDALMRLLVEYPRIGRVLLGELGVNRPNAESHCREDGSAFILVFTGLLDFLEAVTRTAMTGANVTVTGQETVPAVQVPQAVDTALAALYRQWDALWKGEVLATTPQALPAEAEEIAGWLCVTTTLFVILHEYAHAVLHADIQPEERTPAQELEADAWAARQALLGFGIPKNRVRSVLTGAVIMIRALAALQILGHKLPGSHPPPRERLAGILQVVRGMCEDEFAYFHVTTIVTAHDQRMEAAERSLQGLPYLPEVSAERIISTAIAMLIEVHAGRLTLGRAASELRVMFDAAGPEVLRETGAIAARILPWDAPEGPSREPEKASIIENFAAILEGLPPAIRAQIRGEA